MAAPTDVGDGAIVGAIVGVDVGVDVGCDASRVGVFVAVGVRVGVDTVPVGVTWPVTAEGVTVGAADDELAGDEWVGVAVGGWFSGAIASALVPVAIDVDIDVDDVDIDADEVGRVSVRVGAAVSPGASGVAPLVIRSGGVAAVRGGVGPGLIATTVASAVEAMGCPTTVSAAVAVFTCASAAWTSG